MNKLRNLLFVALLVVLSAFIEEYPKVQNYNDGLMDVYFLDVGQGDSALVKTPDKHLVLIDGGPDSNVTYRLGEILPFWVRRIDSVQITHSHADHITGVLYVLQQYDVGCVAYGRDDPPISEIENELRAYIDAHNIVVSDDCLDRSLFSNYYADIDASENQNLESIVTLLDYANFNVLFTGDAEIPVLEQLLPQLTADVDILKVPHHGSEDSFYPELLWQIKPSLAVISVGLNNKFNHPSEVVLSGYSRPGISLRRTDLDGTIHIQSDGDVWEVIK